MRSVRQNLKKNVVMAFHFETHSKLSNYRKPYYPHSFIILSSANVTDCTFFISPASSDIKANAWRSEEHTSELQSLMRISYAVFCLKQKTLHPIQYTL